MKLRPRVVPIVLAGGRGTRLHELTDRTCKPALPMGRHDRMVDWTMDNLLRSGAETVFIATQYCAQDLAGYLHEAWAGRFAGGIATREGIHCTGRACGYTGTADAVRWNMPALRDAGAELVLVTAADHIYNMDFSAMVAAHLDSGAPVTVAASVVAKRHACEFGVFEEDEHGRILSFAEKPDHPVEMRQQPGCSLVSMGIYMFNTDWLEEALNGSGVDFGHDILPHAYRKNEANCYRATNVNGAPIYWKDVGTLDAYRESWLELEREPWRCPSPSGRATCGDDHLASQGTVALPGAIISPEARVRNAILTDGVRLRPGERIGWDVDEDKKWFRVTQGGTVVVTPRMLARRDTMGTPRVRTGTPVQGIDRSATLKEQRP